MSDAVQRPLTPGVFARLADAARYAVTGVGPDSWFGPQQPLAPQAPPEVKGRQYDYPFGANLNYAPRSEGGITLRRTARARRRAAAAARRDRDAQGPDRGAEFHRAPALARRPAGRLRPHRRGARASRPARPAPLVRRLAQDAARGPARHRRGDHLSPLRPLGRALFARHRRRRDHQAADRRGRAGARAAGPGLSAGAARRAGGGFFRRRAPLPAAQRAGAQALRHEPGRADRAHHQHRAEARGGDARLLPHGLRARRVRHRAEGMDDRPVPRLPGPFRRADERQLGAAADAEVHAGRLQADRAAPAAAERPVRRVARPPHLLRLLRARHARSSPRSTARPARPCACRRRRKGSCP